MYISIIYIYMCLLIYAHLYICLCSYLSFFLSIHLSFCLSIYLSVYPSLYLSICLSVCLSICLPIYLSMPLSPPLPSGSPLCVGSAAGILTSNQESNRGGGLRGLLDVAWTLSTSDLKTVDWTAVHKLQPHLAVSINWRSFLWVSL